MIRKNSNSYDLVISVDNCQLHILKAMGIEYDGLQISDNQIVEKSIQNRLQELCEDNRDQFLAVQLDDIESQEIQQDQRNDYEESINFSRIAANYENN